MEPITFAAVLVALWAITRRGSSAPVTSSDDPPPVVPPVVPTKTPREPEYPEYVPPKITLRAPGVSRYATDYYNRAADKTEELLDNANARLDKLGVDDIKGTLAGPLASALAAPVVTEGLGQIVRALTRTTKEEWRAHANGAFKRAIAARDLSTYFDWWASEGRGVSALLGSMHPDPGGGSAALTVRKFQDTARKYAGKDLNTAEAEELVADMLKASMARVEYGDSGSQLEHVQLGTKWNGRIFEDITRSAATRTSRPQYRSEKEMTDWFRTL